jgi:hypothetical protein
MGTVPFIQDVEEERMMEADWKPGDPIYTHPNYDDNPDSQYVRHIIDIFDESKTCPRWYWCKERVISEQHVWSSSIYRWIPT